MPKDECWICGAELLEGSMLLETYVTVMGSSKLELIERSCVGCSSEENKKRVIDAICEEKGPFQHHVAVKESELAYEVP
jgi:hypothetical protein